MCGGHCMRPGWPARPRGEDGMCSRALRAGTRGQGPHQLGTTAGDAPSLLRLSAGATGPGAVSPPTPHPGLRRGVQEASSCSTLGVGRRLRALPSSVRVTDSWKPLSPFAPAAPPVGPCPSVLCLWPPGVALTARAGRGGRGGVRPEEGAAGPGLPSLGKGVPLSQRLWGSARPDWTVETPRAVPSGGGRRLGPKHPSEAEQGGVTGT